MSETNAVTRGTHTDEEGHGKNDPASRIDEHFERLPKFEMRVAHSGVI